MFPSAGKADGKGMTAAQVKLLVVAAGGGLLDRLPRARPLPDKVCSTGTAAVFPSQTEAKRVVGGSYYAAAAATE